MEVGDAGAVVQADVWVSVRVVGVPRAERRLAGQVELSELREAKLYSGKAKSYLRRPDAELGVA